MKFVAYTYPGLETILKKELENRKNKINKVEDGLITFSGDSSTMVKTNLWLRTASKVYLLLGEYDNIDNFDLLFDTVYNINWTDILPGKHQIVINPVSIKSKLSHTPSIQAISQKAIIKKLMGNKKYEFDNDKKVEIRISLFKNQLKILLNTTGDSLYKRGYKLGTSQAQIKETLASGIILLSNLSNNCLDPFCGSGTLLIEKVLIEQNIAPGLFRNFAFEKFSWFDKSILEKEIWRAKTRQKNKKIELIGTDIDPKIIDIAKHNAKNINIDKYIKFYQKDFFSYDTISTDIITNPPYDKRIKLDNIDKLYDKLFELFQKNNLKGGVITGYEDVDKKYYDAFKMRVFSNGGDRVKFFYKK